MEAAYSAFLYHILSFFIRHYKLLRIFVAKVLKDRILIKDILTFLGLNSLILVGCYQEVVDPGLVMGFVSRPINFARVTYPLVVTLIT